MKKMEKLKEKLKELEEEIMKMKQGEERILDGVKIKIGSIKEEEIAWHLL